MCVHVCVEAQGREESTCTRAKRKERGELCLGMEQLRHSQTKGLENFDLGECSRERLFSRSPFAPRYPLHGEIFRMYLLARALRFRIQFRCLRSPLIRLVSNCTQCFRKLGMEPFLKFNFWNFKFLLRVTVSKKDCKNLRLKFLFFWIFVSKI